MTVPAAEPHVAAVLARLTNQLPAAIPTHDAEVPATAGQTYVAVYSEPGWVTRSNLTAQSDHISVVVQTTCVGTSASQARDVTDLVYAAILDHILVVAGRVCWPITLDDAGPPIIRDPQTRDPNAGGPRFFAAPRFRVASVPA